VNDNELVCYFGPFYYETEEIVAESEEDLALTIRARFDTLDEYTVER
jgi:hypothetical protein